MNRRRQSSLAGSPLLIGAVTTLIVIVAVYLAYNANNGLPFVPTYSLKAELPDGANLVKGNDVRMGGERVGIVSAITPHQNPRTGRVVAIVDLKLEKNIEPLPKDTTTIVQSRSSLGLKYVQLEKGKSSQGFKPGATIPLAQAREPVEIDQFFDMFDEKTRDASQQNLTNFGNGLAGRGIGLNNTFATLRPLVNHLIPVMKNLASPQTDLRGLFIGLDRPAAQTAPVANTNAQFFSDLDTTFTAWANVAPSLERTIEGGFPALLQATHSLPFEAPFVRKTAEFMRLLAPSASALRTAAPAFGNAIEAGAINLRAATALNTRLASSLQTLMSFSQNPVVALGLEDLTHTTQVGNPLVAGLAPEQITCNYVTLTFRNLASLLSEEVGVGSVARATVVLSPAGSNNEGYPSSSPANGPSIDKTFTGQAVDDNHIHVNPYPNVAGPGQPKTCEAANEHYIPGKAVIGNLPTNVGTTHDITTREAGLPGAPSSPSVTKKTKAKAKGKKK
jgi:ABC-type transporter Mla subunit MlaD